MQALTTLRPFSSAENSQRRIAGIGFVALIHAVLIYALWQIGVIDYLIEPAKAPITMVNLPSVHPEIRPTQPPPPGRLDTEVKPTEPVIDFDETPVDLPPGPPGNADPMPYPASGGPLGIMNTHTIPPYPPIDVRLGNEGVVSLRVMIDEMGFVSEAAIVRSSGFPRLDAAAVSWVKAHWRYHPARQNGQAVASTASALVKFEIH